MSTLSKESNFKLPCGCNAATFKTPDYFDLTDTKFVWTPIYHKESYPIAGKYATIWCVKHGWVFITKEQFDAIEKEFGHNGPR